MYIKLNIDVSNYLDVVCTAETEMRKTWEVAKKVPHKWGREGKSRERDV